MLTKLKLHNFRTYLNAEVDFAQRHLLIGRNNSGKTSLARAIGCLGECSRGDLVTALRCIPGGVAEFANRQLDSNKIDLSCTCDLEHDGAPCRFQYDLTFSVSKDAPVERPQTLRVT
ncbi:AAA family ATPase, partial [bacterium]|nr:AAA family ATPase [bacterium]